MILVKSGFFVPISMILIYNVKLAGNMHTFKLFNCYIIQQAINADNAETRDLFRKGKKTNMKKSDFEIWPFCLNVMEHHSAVKFRKKFLNVKYKNNRQLQIYGCRTEISRCKLQLITLNF